MADQSGTPAAPAAADTPPANPAAEASKAMGGMMMGESPPFPEDGDLQDHSKDIADIFGLGEEAGPVPNSPESSSDGGASPAGATPAAETPVGQAQPATSPDTQQIPGQQGEQPQAPAQPSPAPAAPPAAPAPAQPPAPDAGVQALTAQVQALIAQNAQLQEQLRQGAGTQAPQPGSGDPTAQPQEADPYMDYRLAMPDDLAAAIFNEDPTIARNGMTHLINSVGRIIHERVLRSVQERVLPQVLSQHVQHQQLSAQQETMRQEYFRDFPQHNEPGIRLIVAQEAQAMWATQPTLEWNATARAALGQRVNARLGLGVVPQSQPAAIPAQQPAAPAAPASAPAAQMGASNRPPANPADNNSDFITATLSAG